MLAALCLATVLAIALGSYLTVCYRTLALSSRSAQDTHSIELAETGMEEALWALNKNDWSTWTLAGTTATKTLSGFSFESGSTGTISLTVTSYDGSAGTRTVTVTGTTQATDGTSVSRTLSSTSAQAPLFVNAVAATTSNVVFSSAGTADSYDSSLGTYASQTPTYSAVIASTATAPTAATVQLVNAQIKGYVASNYSGGPSYSTSGRVYGPTTPVATKIDATRVSTSPYQPIFSIKTISGSGTTLSNPTLNSTTTIGNAADTVPAIYYSSGLDLRGTTKIIVDGPVRLVVSGNFYVGLTSATTAQIEISTNGSLEVFAGNDIAIYAGGINNLTKDPRRLAIYSNNTLTVPDMNTATAFYGVIYTPAGCFTVASNNAIYGSIVAKKVSFTGSAPVIHYDLRLRQTVFGGIDTPYAISDWRESINGS